MSVANVLKGTRLVMVWLSLSVPLGFLNLLFVGCPNRHVWMRHLYASRSATEHRNGAVCISGMAHATPEGRGAFIEDIRSATHMLVRIPWFLTYLLPQQNG